MTPSKTLRIGAAVYACADFRAHLTLCEMVPCLDLPTCSAHRSMFTQWRLRHSCHTAVEDLPVQTLALHHLGIQRSNQVIRIVATVCVDAHLCSCVLDPRLLLDWCLWVH